MDEWDDSESGRYQEGKSEAEFDSMKEGDSGLLRNSTDF